MTRNNQTGKSTKPKSGTRPGQWLLQDAKARFSELVGLVRSEGSQLVTIHGRDAVVVVAAGYTFSHPDLFIAATGLCHGLTVVSRDTADYARSRVPLLNPWAETQDKSPLKPSMTKPGKKR